MKQTSRTGSRLFFIEFLIVLFFFLIISTVCLRLFAQARRITREAEALSGAQLHAASTAEAIEAGEESADRLRLYFDRDFHSCEENQAFYTLDTQLTVDNHWKTGTITVSAQDGRVIYELPFSFYAASTKEEVLS